MESESESESEARYEEVEAILGYAFNDRTLLEGALGEGSTSDFETLVRYGDMSLTDNVGHFLEALYPKLQRREFYLLLEANTSPEKLGRATIFWGFHTFLRKMNSPALQDQIKSFAEETLRFPLHFNWVIASPPQVIVDVFKAMVAAIENDMNSFSPNPNTRDTNTKSLMQVIEMLLAPLIKPSTLKRNPVIQLTELCDKKHLKLAVNYLGLVEEKHKFQIEIADQIVEVGMSREKEVAKHIAATNALKTLATSSVS